MPGSIGRFLRWLVRGASLRIVVPTLVAFALLAYVAEIAAAGRAPESLAHVLGQVGWIAAFLAIPYFALRALTWRLLLDQVGVHAPEREQLAAFSSGELTKSLPGGIYLQAYVLARLENFTERQVVGAAVATTGMDVMIGTVSFLTAFAIGLPRNPWFRVLLAAVAGAWVLLYFGAWLIGSWWHPQRREHAPRWARWVGRIIVEVFESATRLVRPETWRPLATTTVYLLSYVVILYLVLQALEIHQVTFLGAIGVLAITNMANMLLPIPFELGLTEVTGVGVLMAYGVDAPTAAVAMLAYRVVTTGALTVLVGGILIALRDELRARPGPVAADP